MSARALQRVVVRMLYDPALVDAVYAADPAALAEVPLTAAERAWLRAPDRRRWAADPLRRTRGLRALLEEYPVSGALAARAHGVPALDRFFSSATFHACVQGRGSLADAFGRWLVDGGPAPVAAMASLERAIARVRRARPPAQAGEGSTWQTAPWARGVVLPGGGLAAWQSLRAGLGQHPQGPVAALLDPSFGLPEAPFDADDSEGVVVERTGPGEGDIGLGGCPPSLAALLRRLEAPAEWPAVAEALRALGADADEFETVAVSLLADGLLTRG